MQATTTQKHKNSRDHRKMHGGASSTRAIKWRRLQSFCSTSRWSSCIGTVINSACSACLFKMFNHPSLHSRLAKPFVWQRAKWLYGCWSCLWYPNYPNLDPCHRVPDIKRSVRGEQKNGNHSNYICLQNKLKVPTFSYLAGGALISNCRRQTHHQKDPHLQISAASVFTYVTCTIWPNLQSSADNQISTKLNYREFKHHSATRSSFICVTEKSAQR